MRTLGRMRVTFGGGRDPGLTARRVVGPYEDVGPESMVRRGGCPHPPADHGECSLNVRAGEDTGPYGICGNLFKYRRGGSQTRLRAHNVRPYETHEPPVTP